MLCVSARRFLGFMRFLSLVIEQLEYAFRGVGV